MEPIGELLKRRLSTKEWLSIEITHVVNPQKFYFKLTERDRLAAKYVRPNQVAIDILERDINEFYESQGHNAKQSGVFGVKDKVAVWYIPLGKYIRCAILSWECAPDSGSCILWALDYGFVLKSLKQHIRPLPERFHYHIDRILCGGVYGVIPAGCGPDGEELKWNACARLVLMNAIHESVEVQYQSCLVNKHGFSFGALKFKNKKGKETLATVLLLKHDVAVLEEVKGLREFYEDDGKVFTCPLILKYYKLNEIKEPVNSGKFNEKTEEEHVAPKTVPSKQVGPQVATKQIKVVPVEPKNQASPSYSRHIYPVPAGYDLGHRHCASTSLGSPKFRKRQMWGNESVTQTATGKGSSFQPVVDSEVPKLFVKADPAFKSVSKSNNSARVGHERVDTTGNNGNDDGTKQNQVIPLDTGRINVKDSCKGETSPKNKENQFDTLASQSEDVIDAFIKFRREQLKKKRASAPPLRTHSLQNEAISTPKAGEEGNGEAMKPLEKEEPKLQEESKELYFQFNQVQPKEASLSKIIDRSVLVHSNVIPEPVKNLEQAPFAEKVFRGMLREGLGQVYRIQAYAWPHLSSRRNSLFVVNASNTGRTLCYVPALLTYLHSLYEDRPVKENIFGPRAIVLVPSSEKGQKLKQLICSILSGIEKEIVVCCGSCNYIEVKIKLLGGCSLLIATPASMARVMQDNKKLCLIDRKRFNHLILDEADLMSSRCGDLLLSVLKDLLGLCKRNEFNRLANTQLVVTSRMWDPLMMKLSTLADNLMIVLGDFLEAAFYGRAELLFEFVSLDRKIDRVEKFLREHPPEDERLIVICDNDTEVLQLEDQLSKRGFQCIAYTSQSPPDQRLRIQRWKQNRSLPEFLICQDLTFYELDIRDMQNLLHFSLPQNWTQFTKRFAATIMSYENYVQQMLRTSPSSSVTGHSKVTSIVFLDECSTKALNRLVHFVRAHDQLKNLPSIVLQLNEIERRKMEESEEFNQKKLCPYTLEFGECDDHLCPLRHKFTRRDVEMRKAEQLPTEGSLKVVISKVFSPTWFSARLLEHRPLHSQKWSEIRESKRALLFDIKLKLHYEKPENLRRHWPLNVNDVCIYNLQRVRILSVPPMAHPDVVQSVKVDIYLIDVGEVTRQVSSSNLLVCEDRFKDFPAQAVELRLTGVRPSDNERTWDLVSTKEVDNTIRNLMNTKKEVFGEISFSIGSTIWLKELCVMEKLPTLRTFIPQCYLTKMLIGKGYGVKTPPEAMSARRLAEESGLLDIECKKEEVPESKNLITKDEQFSEDLNFPPEEYVEAQISENDLPVKDKYDPTEEDNEANYENSLEAFLQNFTISSGQDPTAALPEADEREITSEPDSALLKPASVDTSENQVTAAAAATPTSPTETAKDPPLRLVAAGMAVRPQVTWYQNEFLIVLKIEVPDVKQHRLEIGCQHLAFRAELKNGDLRSVVINFLYAVDHKQAASEMRGINCVIHLVKRNFHIWERLTEQAVKFPWLKCDLDATEVLEDVMDRELVDTYEYERKMAAKAPIRGDMLSDSDASGDEGGFQTYTKIFNPEDAYDIEEL